MRSTPDPERHRYSDPLHRYACWKRLANQSCSIACKIPRHLESKITVQLPLLDGFRFQLCGFRGLAVETRLMLAFGRLRRRNVTLSARRS
jgi:hypothetical protein